MKCVLSNLIFSKRTLFSECSNQSVSLKVLVKKWLFKSSNLLCLHTAYVPVFARWTDFFFFNQPFKNLKTRSIEFANQNYTPLVAVRRDDIRF